MDSNSRKNRIVGMKQVLRAVEKDALERVYLAEDAQPSIRERVEAACLRYAVPVVSAPDMQTLGRTCGIEVGAACAGVRKDGSSL